MSTLQNPEPAKPPILTNIYDASGRFIATVTRAPGSAKATLRDNEGRLRALLTEAQPGDIAAQALDHIKNHLDDFQPNGEETQCSVHHQQR